MTSTEASEGFFKIGENGVEPIVRETKRLNLPESPEEMEIVGMVTFRNQVLIATKKGVYRIEDGVAVRLQFVEKITEGEAPRIFREDV